MTQISRDNLILNGQWLERKNDSGQNRLGSLHRESTARENGFSPELKAIIHSRARVKRRHSKDNAHWLQGIA
jgi:hypothetical protein